MKQLQDSRERMQASDKLRRDRVLGFQKGFDAMAVSPTPFTAEFQPLSDKNGALNLLSEIVTVSDPGDEVVIRQN